ncbi:hypothetical protein ACFPL7_02790 [Dongia soli]|uniref:Lipoprotein n=1 Tax=Dongia soli TaxID=600628 RepID=A0ABU5EH00_9PROT|nr:hypothetical protein [Dongia soli]MDY0885715.1 hypothetical protein [Dongia soli]
MRQRSKFLALGAVAAVAVLTACSSTSHQAVWTKNNGNPDQRDRDQRGCEAYAKSQTKVDSGIDQDRAVMGGGTNSGLNPTLNENINAYSTQKRYDNLVNSCMTDLGYRAVK